MSAGISGSINFKENMSQTSSVKFLVRESTFEAAGNQKYMLWKKKKSLKNSWADY